MNSIVVANAVTAANVVDVAVLILLFIFCIGGTMRGLAGELARLLGISTSTAAGVLLYPLVREQFASGGEVPWVVCRRVVVVVSAVIGPLFIRLFVNFLKVIIGSRGFNYSGVFANR